LRWSPISEHPIIPRLACQPISLLAGLLGSLGGHADRAAVNALAGLPFVAADDGVAAGEPTECFNPVAVVMRAEALSRKEGHIGAVAFSRTGDPATGDFGDAKVIRKFGNVPDDLSSL
jgi:hypothetical protein